jgi:hypothetical protein
MTALTVLVSAGADDAYKDLDDATGGYPVYPSDDIIRLGQLTAVLGVRFRGVTIPQGSTINSAIFRLWINITKQTTTTAALRISDAANPPNFLETNTSWELGFPWLVSPTDFAVGGVSPDKNDLDFTALLQQVVNRSDWVSGNGIGLMLKETSDISGISMLTYWAYDSILDGASTTDTLPSIIIDYSLAGPPIAKFAVSPATGYAPLTVQFSDQSSGATAWAWDFGDGSGQSNLQNPSYVYSVIGSYTVTLTATNSFGSNSTTRTVNVTTRPPYDPAQFMPFF